MIEIGPNLRDLLGGIVGVVCFLGFFYIVLR